MVDAASGASDQPGGKGKALGFARRIAGRVGLQGAFDAALDAVKLPAALPPAITAQPEKKSRQGSETRARGKAVTIRFSDEEYAQLDTAASNAGLTFPSYARTLLLGEKLKTKSRHRPPVEKELLAKILGQLGKIGSNLNQIGHAANLGEQRGKEHQEACADIRLMRAETMRALGRRP